MIDFLTFFFGVGFIILIKLTWQDFNNNKMINPSYSTFMMGVVVTMFYLKGETLLMLGLIIVSGLVLAFRHKFSQGIFKDRFSIGSGDVTVLTWVIVGLFYFNYLAVLVFFCFWLLGNVFSTFVFKEKFFQGTPSIVFGFVCAWIFLNIIII